jgi:hypothetical protein
MPAKAEPVTGVCSARMRDRMQTHRIPRNFLVYGKEGWGSIRVRFGKPAGDALGEPGGLKWTYDRDAVEV